METDFHDVKHHFTATKSELIAAAIDAGVDLILKTSEDTVLAEVGTSGGEPKQNLCPKRPRPWANETCNSSLDNEADMLMTPESPNTFTAGITVLTPTKTAQQSGKNEGYAIATKLPLTPSTTPTGRTTLIKSSSLRTMTIESNLVFRFYDNDSQGLNSPNGFFAGTFVAGEANDVVPCLYSDDYLRPAESHLKRFQKSSPFISVYDSVLPALHRGLRSSNKASISIIDAHYLIVDGNNEYPRILWVPDIVRELRRRERYTELDYFGQSEWLIWNKVPASAIVATLSVEDLRKYVKKHSNIERVLSLPGI